MGRFVWFVGAGVVVVVVVVLNVELVECAFFSQNAAIVGCRCD